MVWQTILCVLAACGLVLVVWVCLGACVLPLRPRRGRIYILWRMEGGADDLHRCRQSLTWLRESGLLPTEWILWDGGLTPDARRVARLLPRLDPRIHWAEPEQTLERIRENIDGRGTDDSARHSQRRGVSE